MGGAVDFFTHHANPQNFVEQDEAEKLLDPIGGDPLGLSRSFQPEKPVLDTSALVEAMTAAQAADPNLRPFNRPDRTPDLSESALRDRRRSIASSIRRRKTASILTGEPSGADTLGTS